MRVALADDAALLREGLARVLTDAGIDVAAQVGTAGDLLAAVDELRPVCGGFGRVTARDRS